jgi:dTDP-4-amino-4,6-dideoxygalactose transaminase
MINFLKKITVSIKGTNPKLYYYLIKLAKRYFKNDLGIYPRILANEKEAVIDVLNSSQWNMCDGKGLVHEKLEANFSEYVKVPYSIAVNSGGMALQMAFRALGLKPGDEVIHQIDTCSATAMSVMNAGLTPIFADISKETFMIDLESVRKNKGKNTKALIMTHMWGNADEAQKIALFAKENNLLLIEDACLALGAKSGGHKVGCFGDVAVFSFGAGKPIQGGEGGMIVTSNEALARELKAMRHWGDRSFEFGVRDVTQLSWNGRLSEIIAAVVVEQLKGYPSHVSELQEKVQDFGDFLKKNIPGINIQLGPTNDIRDSVFTQVQLSIDDGLKFSKNDLWGKLKLSGIPVWHANFELINKLSLFKNGTWKEFTLKGDINRINENYNGDFKTAQHVFDYTGLGLNKMNFLSKSNFELLKSVFSSYKN